jgi:Disulfide bond formation protein DsbB
MTIEPSTVQLFAALLTLLAMAATATLLVARLMRSHAGAQALVSSVAAVRNPLAASVAATAMLGSLYFSEVANYVPCNLCWYQRIAMYPLAVLLVVATLRREDIRHYVVPLAAIGMLVSSYHWLYERVPSLDAGICSVAVPCNLVWFEEFGFITLAFMALVGFATIVTLITLPQETPHGHTDEDSVHHEVEEAGTGAR